MKGFSMKVHMEIEEEYEYSMDELVSRVVHEKITSQVNKKVQEEINNKMNDMIEIVVNDRINETIANFLDKPITLYDKWGDKKSDYKSVNDLLKERFDKWLDEKVDKNGNKASYGETKRIDFLLTKRLNEASKNFTEEISASIDRKLKDAIRADLKENVSDKILKTLNVDDLIKNLG